MKHETLYPRIEVYTENDYAIRNTGSDKTTDVQGRTVYMGKRVQELYVDRTSYTISTADADSLLSQSLTFLPYFKEVKPPTTLNRYFELDKVKYLPEFQKQFLFQIDGYKAHSENDRFFFNTIIEYQKRQPNSIEIVWLNQAQWFVNNVFYTIDLDSYKKEENRIFDEKLIEGSMTDFIRFSNIIQPKLSEGYNYLRIPVDLFELDPSREILTISLSPGSPGSRSYNYALEGNGKLKSINGRSHRVRLNHYEIVSIMNKINKINFEGYAMQGNAIPRHVDDGQTLTVSAFSNGLLHTVTYRSGDNSMPSIIDQFIQQMLTAFIIENASEDVRGY